MTRRIRFRLILILLAGGIAVVGLRDEQQQREQFFILQSRREPFGVQANAQRERWHVPVLPTNWTTHETSVIWKGAFHLGRTIPNYWQTQRWQNPDRVNDSSGHWQKIIHRLADDVREESDEFYYSVNDVRYRLGIISRFSASDTVTSISYVKQVKPASLDSLMLTIFQRDSILQCCVRQ